MNQRFAKTVILQFCKTVRESSRQCIDKILYGKQFGFRARHSTDHALAELIDSIFDSFNERKHTIGIFATYQKPLTH